MPWTTLRSKGTECKAVELRDWDSWEVCQQSSYRAVLKNSLVNWCSFLAVLHAHLYITINQQQ